MNTATKVATLAASAGGGSVAIAAVATDGFSSEENEEIDVPPGLNDTLNKKEKSLPSKEEVIIPPTKSIEKEQEKVVPETPKAQSKPPFPKPKPQPAQWHPLTLDTNWKQDYEGKIGETFGKYLVAVFGTEEKKVEEWWKQKHDEWKKEKIKPQNNLSSHFNKKEIKVGFKKDPAKAGEQSLNQVCQSVYKLDKSEIKPTDKKEEEKVKLRDNLWKYCSPLGTRPIFVSEQPYPNYLNWHIGAHNKDVLLSTNDNVNDVVWNIKQKEYPEAHSTGNSYLNTVFAKENYHKRNVLKYRCLSLYKFSQTTDASQIPAILEYCSFPN